MFWSWPKRYNTVKGLSEGYTALIIFSALKTKLMFDHCFIILFKKNLSLGCRPNLDLIIIFYVNFTADVKKETCKLEMVE